MLVRRKSWLRERDREIRERACEVNEREAS